MEIQRVPHPLPLRDFYLSYFIPRRPVVIKTRSLEELGWRTRLWTHEYLSYKAGSQEVLVLKRGTDVDYAPESSAYLPMAFGSFLAKVMARPEGDNSLYLNLQTDKIIEPPLLQLLGDFTIPPYFKDLPLRSINMWMGNSHEEITTPLHHDFNDNLYVVAEGRKHFVIFPPQQAENLYTRGKLTGVGGNGTIMYAEATAMRHLSQLNPDKADMGRFPRYAEAAKQRVDFDLEHDEMLFLPTGWFHQVSSTGRHIALSFFAETPPLQQLKQLENFLLYPPRG